MNRFSSNTFKPLLFDVNYCSQEDYNKYIFTNKHIIRLFYLIAQDVIANTILE